jgi:hypothetical protein
MLAENLTDPQTPLAVASSYLAKNVIDLAAARRALIVLGIARLHPSWNVMECIEQVRTLRGDDRRAHQVLQRVRWAMPR